MAEESKFIVHARRELELIGEEPDTIKGYLDMIQIFADMGHSGRSASAFIPTLNELLQFKNLAPLTDDPADWIEVGPEFWQNRRNSECFSTDGGKTYVKNSELGMNPRPVHTSRSHLV